MNVVIKLALVTLFSCVRVGITGVSRSGVRSNGELSTLELASLTNELKTDLYTKTNNFGKLVYKEETKGVDFGGEIEDKVGRMSGVKEAKTNANLNAEISNSAMNTLRFNWELGNYEIKKEVQWVIFLLIFNSDKYVSAPKEIKLIDNYKDCLLFLKGNNIKLLTGGNVESNDYTIIIQRGCVIYMDKYWKLINSWSGQESRNDEFLLQYRKIVNSDLYLMWREIYKIDPARSQWYVLRELSLNRFDETLRLLRILVKDEEEYDSIQNIVTEYMVQFKRNRKKKDLGRKNLKREYNKMKNNWENVDKNAILRRLKKKKDEQIKIDLKIYLPKEMPDMYVYHTHIKTCVLNLTIMSLFQENKVYFYDVFSRTERYYTFHKKSVSVNRRALLRSNQLCSLMFELTTRLERIHHLLEQKNRKNIINLELLNDGYFGLVSKHEANATYGSNSTKLAKKLSFHPYYYSVSSDIETEKYYTSCLLDFNESKCITEFEGYVSGYVKKNKDLFNMARIDLLGKLETEEDVRIRRIIEEENDDHGLFIKDIQVKKDLILEKYRLYYDHVQGIISNYKQSKKLESLSDHNNISNYVSFIQILYLNSRLWNMEKLWFKYPVSFSLDLSKSIDMGNQIDFGDDKLGNAIVDNVSLCIKVVTVLWKNECLLVNDRKFRILDPGNSVEFYKKSKGLSKVYQDYSTIYLICIKAMSQNLIYYRRFLKYYYSNIEYENNWKLCKYYDISDDFGNPSISFQYINDNNVYLQSLPNDYILPLLNKAAYFSIAASYILLCITGLSINMFIFFGI